MTPDNNSISPPAGIAEAGAESADIANSQNCDPSKIQKGEQLIIATHNSITFLKATNENGKILPGDYLTASSKAGYAAKADEDSIVLIGRALEALNQSEGKISAFIQITTSNAISNINVERLLEEEDEELEEIEEEYSTDLSKIKQTKALKEDKLQRIKKKLQLAELNVTVSSAASSSSPQAAPQITQKIDYMEKVNGSVIIRIG